jgi:hypothetical protein
VEAYNRVAVGQAKAKQVLSFDWGMKRKEIPNIVRGTEGSHISAVQEFELRKASPGGRLGDSSDVTPFGWTAVAIQSNDRRWKGRSV